VPTSVPVVPPGGVRQPSGRHAPHAAYLRDSRSGIIAARPAPLREHRDDIRMAWRRSAGLALDLMQNSGRLRGAADQVIADTVGAELQINPQPDPAAMARLGYNEAETAEFIRLIKQRWKRWSWNPAECDMRGKLTVPQMVDIGLRWNMAFGEVTGTLTYMTRGQRRAYGIGTGTKVCLVPPSRLVQDTNEMERMFQGVRHDVNGRPIAYRFEEHDGGLKTTRDWPARDARGRPMVIHVYDPVDAGDVRGISVLASAFRKYIQHEMLDDATLQTAVLQTVFAATLTSELPSAEAFEALEELKRTGEGKDLYFDIMGLIGAQLDRARETSVNVSSDPVISHLAPGEDLNLKAAQTPGSEYLPFSKSLSRDAARAIGIAYGAYSMDHESATYSSVRMETSSIWPVVTRRRERIAGAQSQMIYEVWLDEEIGEGRIPFRGGYAAFAANRDEVSWAQWQGPARPTADDHKSARAASERIGNGTSTAEIEAAELGHDYEELRDARLRDHQWHIEHGMVSPYDRQSSGARTPDDARDDQREELANG
jgi:lambda family phage portal protein